MIAQPGWSCATPLDHRLDVDPVRFGDQQPGVDEIRGGPRRGDPAFAILQQADVLLMQPDRVQGGARKPERHQGQARTILYFVAVGEKAGALQISGATSRSCCGHWRRSSAAVGRDEQ